MTAITKEAKDALKEKIKLRSLKLTFLQQVMLNDTIESMPEMKAPSEDEVEKEATGYMNKCGEQVNKASAKYDWKKGANYVINYMKGEAK